MIDEYGAMVHRVLVGGGISFFPRQVRLARDPERAFGRRMDLELVETCTHGSRAVYLRHRVVR